MASSKVEEILAGIDEKLRADPHYLHNALQDLTDNEARELAEVFSRRAGLRMSEGRKSASAGHD